MRNDWEKGPDEFEEEFVEEPGESNWVIDFIKEVPDSVVEAGKDLLSLEDEPDKPLDINELTADERLAKYDDLYEQGLISQPEWEDKFHRYISEKGREQFTEDLESVGLSMDDLIDLSEDFQILERHDIETMDKKDELRTRLATGELESGPAQDLADEMLEDGEISKDTHSTISRTIELSKKRT